MKISLTQCLNVILMWMWFQSYLLSNCIFNCMVGM